MPADHADEAEHRADRQVDAAGNDHGRHAETHDADESEVAKDVEKVARGEEGRGGEGQVDEGDDRGEEYPEGLLGDQPAQRAVGLPVDGLVEGRRGAHGYLCASRRGWRALRPVSIAPVIRPVTSSGEEAWRSTCRQPWCRAA